VPAPTALAPTACAVCGSGDLIVRWRVPAAEPADLIPTTDRFGTALADIARCRACGHMQLVPMPAAADLSEAYGEAASEAYVEEEPGQRETARRIIAILERHASRGALLDLGCWVGFLLSEAERSGWRTQGVEPSAFASAYARDRLGLDVITAELLDAGLPGRFDAVFMGDVIEHLPDPAAALARVQELLAPGGALALALPDAGSRVARVLGRRWWSVIPTHVQYFTRASIARLLERGGYEVLEIRTAPKAFTVRYYLGRIGGYSRPLARLLVRLAEVLRLADRMWAPDFRDRMLVIARPRP
jgi:SAM-dependent methyltransferase